MAVKKAGLDKRWLDDVTLVHCLCLNSSRCFTEMSQWPEGDGDGAGTSGATGE